MTAAQRVLTRLARTRLGRRALEAVVLADPKPALTAIGARLSNETTFEGVRAWPVELRGFDDVAFLLSSNRANAGIASLMLDEAAYLYRLTRDLGASTIVEIGRYKGGSTFLLAAAMDGASRLFSYDPHVKLRGEDPDAPLRAALARFGLDTRTTLVVADSKTAQPPDSPVDLVFVDGDHSYEGVSADYERWAPRLRGGGHLLFHDALDGEYAVADPGVRRFIEELRGDLRVRWQAEVGSVAHVTWAGED